MKGTHAWIAVGVTLMVLGHGVAVGAGPNTTPTHKRTTPIGGTPETRFESLTGFCLDREGNIVACDAGRNTIDFISPDGRVLSTRSLTFAPQAVCAHADGAIYVGGEGKLAKLDDKGTAQRAVDVPAGRTTTTHITSMSVTGKDLFVAVRGRTGYSIYRFNRDLGEPKEIVKGLRGCCGVMSVSANDDAVYVAENGRHRVVRYDRNGKPLSQWGRRDRYGVEGFGGCCNPMNVGVGLDGGIYTSETGPNRVKRYTPDGKFLSMVVDGLSGPSCKNASVAVSKDGTRGYVLGQNTIRVLVKK